MRFPSHFHEAHRLLGILVHVADRLVDILLDVRDGPRDLGGRGPLPLQRRADVAEISVHRCTDSSCSLTPVRRAVSKEPIACRKRSIGLFLFSFAVLIMFVNLLKELGKKSVSTLAKVPIPPRQVVFGNGLANPVALMSDYMYIPPFTGMTWPVI